MNAPASSPGRLLRGSTRIADQDSASITAAASAADAIRIMIVDDSLTVRTIFKRMVEGAPDMAVVATASSAERAIAQLKKDRVDLILLDLEMPGMGGLGALPTLLETCASAQVLVVSSLTQDGAEHTISALSMGAADTMLKPRPGGFNDEYRNLLLGKIRALAGREPNSPSDGDACVLRPETPEKRSDSWHPEVLAIGASTGGIHALGLLLRGLAPTFRLPILITQHLPASFITVFARQIETISARKTVIAEDGTAIEPGMIAVATGHGHMVVKRGREGLVAHTSGSPARSGCLPSVDPMFESLAKACNGRVLGVLLSGMGRDGFEGAQSLAAAGGMIFAQDAESSAVWGMPGAVAKAGLASLVAPPEALCGAIMSASAHKVRD